MDLEQLVAKKSELEKRRERLLGKMESARASLSELDRKLTERGINPEDLEDEIIRLKSKRDDLMKQLSEAITETEAILTRIETRVENL
jgi:chromosome segregation ATPase